MSDLLSKTPAPDGRSTATPVRAGRPSSPALAALRTVLPLLLAVVVLSIFSNSRNDAFLTWNNFNNILTQIAALGILAAGQTFLIIGGQMDLSVGSMVSFLAVLAAKMLGADWSDPAVIALCLVVGVVVGAIWGLIVAFLKVPPFILTLGGLSIFASLALVLANNTPVAVPEGLDWLGFGQPLGLRTPAFVLLVVLILAGLVLHFTKFGRNVYALGSSPQAAYLAGIPTKRLTVELFMLNGLIVGIAGLVMMARLSSGDPRSGIGLELSVIAATVLGGAALAGGRGTMVGTFFGALVFGVVGASLTFLRVPGAYQSLVSGGILVFAVLATALADRYRESGRRFARRAAATPSSVTGAAPPG
ncbi:ABC transporter permease [Nakamurella alba]|uniref:ABC transporter permease n=1 Tax=Nakamurella alba TaxID=2665158 RepID=UPI0018AC1CCA|nr:ABC transporter permease [Nakamurella alba]